MNLLEILVVFFGVFGETYAQQTTVLDSLLLGIYRSYRKIVLAMDSTDTTVFRTDFQMQLNESEKFPCSLEHFKSERVPINVHNLMPGDIDIVGAMGDSLTAGYGIGATNLYNIVKENRGMVFSIGGQSTWRQFLTVPNILKLYNPKLVGYSLGPSLTVDRESQFNTAENGAVSENLPYMTKVLIERIRKDPRTDLNNHWKMITIFIGANDFCSQICYYKNSSEALSKHKNDLLKSLRLLRDYLPRTFVNIVLPPDVSLLKKFTNQPPNCLVTQRISCPCFVGTKFERRLNELREVVRKFQMLEVEIAAYKEFDRQDFAVVAQPFFLQAFLPNGTDGFTDRDYFSIDCFHFSQKAQAEASKAFWNNILEPVGQKGLTFLVDKLKCPTIDNPFLKTNRNSL